MTDETDSETQETTGIERLTELLREATPTSRRSFLVKSAAVGGVALGGTGVAFANEHGSDSGNGSGGSEGTPEEGGQQEDMSDVEVLNYALTLEHLEAAFYEEGLSQFDEQALADSSALEDACEGDGAELYERLTAIGEHETAHVDALTTVVEQLGGTPVERAEYNFGLSDADTFLETASVLENTGVAAYDGAIAMIESSDLVTAGATIATVEARHAAYLNDVIGKSPFPDAFDPTATVEETLDAAGGFFADSSETPDSGDSDSECNGESGDGGHGEDGNGTDTSTDTPTDTPDNGTDTPDDNGGH